MKKTTILLLIIALLSACKKETHSLADRPVSAGIIPPNPIMTGVLGDPNVPEVFHLTSSIIWHLNGLVFISPGDQLIIDAGTQIKADPSTNPSLPGGGLVITRGAKIDARGTATAPIVITSAAASPIPGDCGGVVIIGNAPTNDANRVIVEGIPSLYTSNIDCTYGGSTGTDAADNSGFLQYVRIEYAGFELSLNNEINGLTLAGVGTGTTIDHVEIYKSMDDAFEFFGGTVNVAYLLAIDPLDDMFDFDNGYIGTISYALGLSDLNRADKSGSNGIESDNNSTGSTTALYTRPVINHMTVVGLPNATQASITNGQPSGTGTYFSAADLRRNTRFSIQNSIFMGFNKGLYLDGSVGNTPCDYVNGFSNLTSNIFHGYVASFSATGSPCSVTLPSNNISFINANPNLAVQLLAPFVRPSGATASNWFPATTASPAQVRGAGAFSIGTPDWTVGWSRY